MARVDMARLGGAAAIERPGMAWSRVANGAATGLLFFFLFMTGGAMMAFFFGGGWELEVEPQDSTVPRLINLLMVLAAATVTLLNARAIAEEMVRTPILPLLMVLACCSIFWSVSPDYSMRRVLFFIAFTLLSVWSALRFDVAQIVRVMAIAGLVAIVLSAVFAVVPPRLGIGEGGQMRGIYVHKNVFGLALAMFTPAFLLAWRYRLMPRWLTALGLLGVLGCLVAAQSGTSIGMFAMMLGIQMALNLLQMPRYLAAAAAAFGLTVVAAFAFVVMADVQLIFDLFGRDATLTGRTDLWALVITRIEQRPWFGYGYAAFWSMPENFRYARDAFGWAIPHSHSGYLETWLGLGIFGLLLAVLLVIQSLVRGFMALSAASDRLPGEFAILYCIPYIIRNFTEADLAGLTTTWIIAVIAAIATSRAMRAKAGTLMPAATPVTPAYAGESYPLIPRR